MRNDFVLNLCSCAEQPSYTLTVTSKMSNSPDSFTFTVGKLGTCTLSLPFLVFDDATLLDAGMAVRVSASGERYNRRTNFSPFRAT